MTTELWMKTLSTAQLVGLFRYALESREQLAPEEMKDVEERVLDFLARTARTAHPCAALLGTPELRGVAPPDAMPPLRPRTGVRQDLGAGAPGRIPPGPYRTSGSDQAASLGAT